LSFARGVYQVYSIHACTVLRVFATRSQVGVSGEGWGWGYAFDAIFAISNNEDVLSSLEGY
jgi:hypothetical protein